VALIAAPAFGLAAGLALVLVLPLHLVSRQLVYVAALAVGGAITTVYMSTCEVSRPRTVLLTLATLAVIAIPLVGFESWWLDRWGSDIN